MAQDPFQECDICGAEVPPEEFDRGRAIRVLGKIYCPTCTAQAIKRSRTASTASDFGTPHPPSKQKDRRRPERKRTSIAVELLAHRENWPHLPA